MQCDTLPQDPAVVAERVRKRAEVRGIYSSIQVRLRLARFKATRGLADVPFDQIPFDQIVPKSEADDTLDRIEFSTVTTPSHDETQHRSFPFGSSSTSGNHAAVPTSSFAHESSRSASSSSASDPISDASSSSTTSYTTDRGNGNILTSSPRLPSSERLYSDAAQRSGGSAQSHRKRMAAHDMSHPSTSSTPTKRTRTTAPASPPTNTSEFSALHHATLDDLQRLAHSSPTKTLSSSSYRDLPPLKASQFYRHPPHQTSSTSTAQDMSSDEDDSIIPLPSSRARSPHPPTTPILPSRTVPLVQHHQASHPHQPLHHISNNIMSGPAAGRLPPTSQGGRRTGEEGADLLMYLATSPTPALRHNHHNHHHNHHLQPQTHPIPPDDDLFAGPPSTPPSKNASMALPSSMMRTPGGTSLFATPGPHFDLSDYVNITPSPAPAGKAHGRTPITAIQRQLTYE